MPVEFWERVRVDELRSGDIVNWCEFRCKILGIMWDDKGDMIRFQFCTDDNHYFQDKVFHKLYMFRLYPRPLWSVLRKTLALLQTIRSDGYTPQGSNTLALDMRISDLKEEVGNDQAWRHSG